MSATDLNLGKDNAQFQWLAQHPLVLASYSKIRSELLNRVFIPHFRVPADIDERNIENEFLSRGESPAGVAAVLARQKALSVSRQYSGHFVLGADQTCILNNEALHKPQNTEFLAVQLKLLRNKTHNLRSAVAIVRDGILIAECEQQAHVTMRNYSDEFIDQYIAYGGPELCSSVGGYQIEGAGSLLFSSVEGDLYTIMGFPILPVLGALRDAGALMP